MENKVCYSIGMNCNRLQDVSIEWSCDCDSLCGFWMCNRANGIGAFDKGVIHHYTSESGEIAEQGAVKTKFLVEE